MIVSLLSVHHTALFLKPLVFKELSGDYIIVVKNDMIRLRSGSQRPGKGENVGYLHMYLFPHN